MFFMTNTEHIRVLNLKKNQQWKWPKIRHLKTIDTQIVGLCKNGRKLFIYKIAFVSCSLCDYLSTYL